MNGAALALGAMGALAVGAAVGRRGSRAANKTPIEFGVAFRRWLLGSPALGALRLAKKTRGLYHRHAEGWVEYPWTQGGCFIAARVLLRWLGRPATLMAIVDAFGDPHHVVVQYGSLFLDADGVRDERTLMEDWARHAKTFVRDQTWTLQPLRHEILSTAKRKIACPLNSVNELWFQFVRAFGEKEAWGFGASEVGGSRAFTSAPTQGLLLGYRVMRAGPTGRTAVSGANPRLKVALKHDAVHTYPGAGMFLGDNPDFVLDHYAIHDQNVLLTYAFSPEDVRTGRLDDRESEVSVGRATLLDWTILPEAE